MNSESQYRRRVVTLSEVASLRSRANEMMEFLRSRDLAGVEWMSIGHDYLSGLIGLSARDRNHEFDVVSRLASLISHTESLRIAELQELLQSLPQEEGSFPVVCNRI